MKHAAVIGTVLISGLLVLSACGMVAPVVPPQGMFYTGYSAPLDLDQSKTPVTQKAGKSSVTSILGLFSWGDASIDAAAREGGIQTIESADYSYTSVLGIYQQYTTIVHGN